MKELELDFHQPADLLMPDFVKGKYRTLVSRVVQVNPQWTPLEALDNIQKIEKEHGADLFWTRLAEDATKPQKLVRERKTLGIIKELNILTEEEKGRLGEIDVDFYQAASTLSNLRSIPVGEADDLLMNVLKFRRVNNFEDAIEKLTKGPIIEGFSKEEIYGVSNEEIRDVLQAAFDLEAILKARIMLITKVDGFPVNCPDIDFGNHCVTQYGAEWAAVGSLVLPDRDTYEKVEMYLEDVSSTEQLEHAFKLRAVTDNSGGFATTRIFEFVVEQPSHFDYLRGLPLPEIDKMRAYFLGIIAHEAVHAMKAYSLNGAFFDSYKKIAPDELSQTLEHRFVSKYVDRHKEIYASDEDRVLNEDFSEAVRIYLTNSEFLKTHYPQRYDFIQKTLPFVRENAILAFVNRRIQDSNLDR